MVQTMFEIHLLLHTVTIGIPTYVPVPILYPQLTLRVSSLENAPSISWSNQMYDIYPVGTYRNGTYLPSDRKLQHFMPLNKT